MLSATATRRRGLQLAAPVLSSLLLMAACGNDDPDTTASAGASGAEAEAETTTSEPTTAVSPEDDGTADDDGAALDDGGAPEDGGAEDEGEPASPEAQAAMDAWATVFDSGVDFADKAPHLEDAVSLEVSNQRYQEAGESLGGITLEPSAAAIDGDTATITYDVLFGGTAAYSDLDGIVTLVDGAWVVGRDEYCGFLASARTPCDG